MSKKTKRLLYKLIKDYSNAYKAISKLPRQNVYKNVLEYLSNAISHYAKILKENSK